MRILALIAILGGAAGVAGAETPSDVRANYLFS